MSDIPKGYTPGPWVLGPAATILGADGTRVCQVAVRIDQYDIANGHLITSAPDMADTITRLQAEVERLRAALNQWLDALNDKRAFEHHHPDNLGKEWARLREAVDLAEDNARAVLQPPSQEKSE